MQVDSLTIADVKLIVPRIFRDDRGFFSETWNAAAFAAAGIDATFVQDNHALSRDKYTVRGLHFQLPPMAQDKLVRVVRGSILDVAVDLRRDSPTYGQHVAAVLSAANWMQIWVPNGFAHGYCTLETDTEVIYKVTAPYAPALDRGIAFDDPALNIPWPVTRQTAILSEKDRKLPLLADLGTALERMMP
jgi:dTDP-4-dehydrorhamnose 3,5-epimerase